MARYLEPMTLDVRGRIGVDVEEATMTGTDERASGDLPTRSQDLAELIGRWTTDANTVETAVPGLTLHRWDAPTENTSYLLGPSICLIGQGAKRVLLGDETYVYDKGSFLLSAVDLPITARIIEASPSHPYFGVNLLLDLQAIAQLVLDHPTLSKHDRPDQLGIAVGRLTLSVQEPVIRLVSLLATPDDIPVLAPLIKREIYYRLLVGEQGVRLAQMLSSESHAHKIARAVDWLRQNYRSRLSIDDLAAKAGLSVSAFHSNFRAVTALSPLQFQKKMRLSEARRLMFTENKDASTAAFEVGYESPSQFSREYRRLFGDSPRRDIQSLIQVSAR